MRTYMWNDDVLGTSATPVPVREWLARKVQELEGKEAWIGENCDKGIATRKVSGAFNRERSK